MNSLSAEKTELIKNIIKKHGLHNTRIELQGQTEKGDGYMGIIEFINVTEESGSKTLELVIKSAKTNEKFRELSPVRNVFLREIYLYETIHPAFKSFQDKNGILKPFTSIPKMFGSSAVEYQETLILENIKTNAYSLWDRKVPMGADHVGLIFEEYAKLHAVSLAMRNLEPDNYKKLTVDLTDVFDNRNSKGAEQFFSMTKEMFEKALEAVEGGSSAVKESLKKFGKEVRDFFINDVENTNDHLVVLHADCWCNNMMFKYEEKSTPTKPTKVCLLDWQVSRTGSPAIDLAYFLIVSASMDVINDYKKYLLLYHEAVRENLKNFGCDTDEIFPYELLETHWKKYARYGLVMAMLLTHILLRDSEDTPDLEEVANDGENLMEALVKSKSSDEAIDTAYKNRISGLVIFMAENGLI